MALAVLAAVPAQADGRDYVNATGDFGILPTNCDGALTLSQGGVCFPGGHVTPNADGQATITILDQFFNPVSAFHCHDLDFDAVCGEAHDPAEQFCGTHTLRVGEDWNVEDQILILIDGPIFGNPVNSVCGTFSMGLIGTVAHS